MTNELRAGNAHSDDGRREAEGGTEAAPSSLLRPPPVGTSTSRWSPAVVFALALSLAVFVLGVRHGSRTAGGSDSYGYLSQADLWLRGNLHVDQAWAARFAWPDAGAVFTPLAYRPGTTPHTIVPTYPPGLSLLMAAFSAVGGRDAQYLVVPLMGALAIWMTWLLGRRAGGGVAGLLAALLLASSPAFLFHLMQPMSDVPATTMWLASALLLAGPAPRPVAAGLAAALAILIRPNLAPLAIVLAAVPMTRIRLKADSTSTSGIRLQQHSRPLAQALRFTLGLLPGVVIYGAFNAALYGGPLNSGYGTFGELFTLHAPGTTLMHYLRLLAETQTVFVGLVPLGCVALLTRRDGSAAQGAGDRRELLVVLAGTILVVLGFYAFYVRFDEWTYLRYLLPAYPAMFVLCVAALQWVVGMAWQAGSGKIRRAAPGLPPSVIVAALCFIVAAVTWRNAVGLGLYDIARFESRYERVANSVARLTPPNAAILSGQHSGTLRYYASRVTVRYDLLDPAFLDRALKDLNDAGFRPYILLEDWELEAFRARFGKLTATGDLDRSPIARLWPRPEIFLYDAQDAGLPPKSGASR